MQHKKPTFAERHEHYHLVLFQIADRWRLAVDKTYLQWLCQKNEIVTGPAEWRSQRFFLTRKGIIDYVHELSRIDDVYPDVMERVMELPSQISEFRGKQKAAAKASAFTTTSLDNWKYTGSGALKQHFVQEKQNERS